MRWRYHESSTLETDRLTTISIYCHSIVSLKCTYLIILYVNFNNLLMLKYVVKTHYSKQWRGDKLSGPGKHCKPGPYHFK